MQSTLMESTTLYILVAPLKSITIIMFLTDLCKIYTKQADSQSLHNEKLTKKIIKDLLTSLSLLQLFGHPILAWIDDRPLRPPLLRRRILPPLHF